MQYVDFHTHVLPHLDDGSKNIDISIEMMKKLYNEKVSVAFATPHFYWYNESVDSFIERRHKSYELLKEAISDLCDVPELRLGAEIRIAREIPVSEHIERLKLEGTELMIFELPYAAYNVYMGENIHNISIAHNILPVIAHPERYISLYSDDDYYELMSIPNVIFQITSDFTASKKTSEFTANIIREGIPVIFGSDCHNMNDRRPVMGSLLGNLKKFCSKYRIPEREIYDLFDYQMNLAVNA